MFDGDPAKFNGWLKQTNVYMRAYDINLESVRSVEIASILAGHDWWTSQFCLVETAQAQPLGS